MTLPEELSRKYAAEKRAEMDGLRGYDILLDDTIECAIKAAINEALEQTARECDSVIDLCTKTGRSEWGAAVCAEKIRAMRSERTK